jgi:hypothetical protein
MRTGVLGLQIECSHASRAVEQRFCVMIGLASTLIRPANYCSPWKSIERKPSSIERKVHVRASFLRMRVNRRRVKADGTTPKFGR